MVHQPAIKPTLIIPDAAPLIHLAAGEALHLLNALGRVIIVDVVLLEATYRTEKAFAGEIAAWVAAGQTSGANAPVEIAETDLGPVYRLALEQGVRTPRSAGEIAITEWLAKNLPDIGGTALVVYESGAVPNISARRGVAATVAVATTRNLLHLARWRALYRRRRGALEPHHSGGPYGKSRLGHHVYRARNGYLIPSSIRSSAATPKARYPRSRRRRCWVMISASAMCS
jgi:hypothetical protein